MFAPLDTTDMLLESPRLMLRGLRQSDLEDYFVIASDREAAQKAEYPPADTMEDAQQMLNWVIEAGNMFAIVEKTSGRMIGYADLHPSYLDGDERYEQYPLREVGFAIIAACRGKGYMPEALDRILQFCREEGTLLVTAFHHTDNPASGRVLEKCGFVLDRVGEAGKYYRCPLQ